MAVEKLREAHFGSLRAAVDTAGGTVVKNLGDGLMVIGDTPTAGLSCAVLMQQAVERSNRGAVEQLAMRVGIATGEATESDGDFFGDPVVEAARLCAVAKGGQILATDLVRAVAGRHASPGVGLGWGFGVEGAARSGGLRRGALGAGSATSPPWSHSRVVWRRGPGIGFVGRAEELGVLAEVLKEAGTQRRRRLVLVGGEPGIGKVSAGRSVRPLCTCRWLGGAVRALR